MKMSEIKEGEQLMIFVLVGLPASGKSTWVKQKLSGSPYSFDVISSDDKIEAHAQEQGKTYSEVFKDFAPQAMTLIRNDFRKAIKMGRNIIWDQTNMTVKKRKSILSQVPNKYKKIAVVFEIDRDELFRRLNDRAEIEGKHIPEKVITDMANMYQAPTQSEGFDEIIMAN